MQQKLRVIVLYAIQFDRETANNIDSEYKDIKKGHALTAHPFCVQIKVI